MIAQLSETSEQVGWENEIRAREDEAVTAFRQANLGALDRLMADGYLVNSPVQRVIPKCELFELLRSGRLQHLTYTCAIEAIQRHGDVVVVMGHDVVTDPPDGAITRRRYTNIWRRDTGAWRAIARHAHALSREVSGPAPTTADR